MNESPAQASLTTLNPTLREIALVIPAADVEAERTRAAGRYAAQARIAGFRRGKAPLDMVLSLYRDEIRKDIVDELVPRALHRELEAYRIRPATPPVMEDVEFAPDGSLRCRVRVEVVPEFELPDLGGLRVPVPPAEPGEEEVRQALENLRVRAAEYVPVEGRGVRDGDYVVVELQGTDVASRKRLPKDRAVVLAGHPDNESGLNEHLAGARPGEERVFTVAYEAGHQRRRLAGKTIEYRAAVQEVKERRLPELDDEFAKTLGDFAGLAELEAKVRAGLRQSRERARREAAAAEALRELTRRVQVELPEGLVEQEAMDVLRRMLSASPRDPNLPAEPEALRAEARARGRQSILNRLVLDKIALREGFEAGEEEVRQEIRAMAAANNVPFPQLLDSVEREGRLEEFRERLLLRKAIDFLSKAAIMESNFEKP